MVVTSEAPEGRFTPKPPTRDGSLHTPRWTRQGLAPRLASHPQETPRASTLVVSLVSTKKEVMYLLGSAILSILHSEKIAKEQRRKKR